MKYKSEPYRTEKLVVDAQLTAEEHTDQLDLKLHLTNLSKQRLAIKDITISTYEGVRSTPINHVAYQIDVPPKTDSTILLSFTPINNLKLFQLTGERGPLKQEYHLNLTYGEAKNVIESPVLLRLTLPEDKFKKYKLQHKEEPVAYTFKSDDQYVEEQKRHLRQLKIKEPFVYLSEQEIAVAGMNIRMKAYNKKDSLHMELLLVNHAPFAIALDTASLAISVNDRLLGGKRISFKKISGSGDENMIKKGDRILILLTQYLKASERNNDLLLHLKEGLLIKKGNSLLCKNIYLVRNAIQD